ncbi:MAG: N-acetylmuramoyl-L-alanine amidase [Bacteroidales bacterium]|nr:N-acetylmuramoyl-L-alanine amidase [Bacteroidales bacterium]
MTVLLDNGHGGLIDNKYQTKGKQKKWSDGTHIYEGEFNRAIVNGIIEKLTALKIPYVNIAPEYRDVSLQTRVNRANKYNAKKCFYLSIHANAGGGHGSEIFTSSGETKSDKIATIFGEEYKKEYPNKKLRTDYSDGDLDKEDRYTVLLKTKMPAILTENFFMDNKDECKDILLTKEGRERIINWHVEAILRVMGELY